jgi:hypothetical protein
MTVGGVEGLGLKVNLVEYGQEFGLSRHGERGGEAVLEAANLDGFAAVELPAARRQSVRKSAVGVFLTR